MTSAKLYTTQGRLLPPASESVSGRKDIQVFWQGAMEVGIAQAKLETVELDSYRETAIEVGKYTLILSGFPSHERQTDTEGEVANHAGRGLRACFTCSEGLLD